MVDKKVAVSFVLGAAVVLALGFIALVQLGHKAVEDARMQRTAIIMDHFEKAQARLGARCIDSDGALLRYVNAVAERAKDVKRLSLSDPIIEFGEKTADILQTCRLQVLALESVGNKDLSGLAIKDDVVMQDFYVIRLALTTATNSWCNADCMKDAMQKVSSSVTHLKQRLAPPTGG